MQNRLRVLRAEYGWSQAELAERLGVSRQTVNALETGKYDPTLPLAFKIAQLFGQRIEQLFFPEGMPVRPPDAPPAQGEAAAHLDAALDQLGRARQLLGS
jgi:putative transcriptional regulator